MKIKSKIIFSLLISAMLILSSLVPAGAAKILDYGECGKDGDNIKYKLYDTGELVITGTGEMRDYGSPFYSPFAGKKNIKNVTISYGITTIGGRLFDNCSLKQRVILPETVKTIKYAAFANCKELPSIELPSGLTSIEWDAFEDCKKLNSVVIPQGITKLDSSVFSGCSSLSSIQLPGSLTEIGIRAFFSCTALKSISIPESVTKINNYAFSRSGLTDIKIPHKVNFLGEDVFNSCDCLTSVTVPGNIVNPGDSLFRECENLRFAAFGEGVETINSGCFYLAPSVSAVFIPESVKIINSAAFSGCDNFTDVYYAGTESEWNSIKIKDANLPLMNADIHYNCTKGDVDRDNNITAADARLTLRASVNLTALSPLQSFFADLDLDIYITASDARLILRKSVGLK